MDNLLVRWMAALKGRAKTPKHRLSTFMISGPDFTQDESSHDLRSEPTISVGSFLDKKVPSGGVDSSHLLKVRGVSSWLGDPYSSKGKTLRWSGWCRTYEDLYGVTKASGRSDWAVQI